jgi:hypothetical protein
MRISSRVAQALVGLACGLWSLTLLGRVPAGFPIAAGVWYAPTILVLLSGALGGWMMDLRAAAGTFSREAGQPHG